MTRPILNRTDGQAPLVKQRGEEADALDEGFIFWAENSDGEMVSLSMDSLGRLVIQSDLFKDISIGIRDMVEAQLVTNELLAGMASE